MIFLEINFQFLKFLDISLQKLVSVLEHKGGFIGCLHSLQKSRLINYLIFRLEALAANELSSFFTYWQFSSVSFLLLTTSICSKFSSFDWCKKSFVERSSIVLHLDINDSKKLLFINFMTHMKKIGLRIRYSSIYV